MARDRCDKDFPEDMPRPDLVVYTGIGKALNRAVFDAIEAHAGPGTCVLAQTRIAEDRVQRYIVWMDTDQEPVEMEAGFDRWVDGEWKLIGAS